MTTMKNNKSGRYLFSAFCIILAVCTAFVASLQLIAKAAEPVYYVEDVKIYAGEGKSKAKKYFESIGYVAANIDLNADTDTGKDAWLGYKLTTNKDMAVTDIRLMGMDTGYQLYDYNALVDYLRAENAGTAQTLLKLSEDFAEKYKAGSPKAKDALEGLNLFSVNDQNKTKLGDYILSGKANLYFYINLIVKGSAGTINSILGFLNVGIAPYENEYDEETGGQITTPWAGLVTKSTVWGQLEAGLTADEEQELHQKYNDLARELFKQIQDFTTMYQNAAARMQAKNNKVEDNSDIDTMEEAYREMNEMETEDTDPIYINAYEILNTYPFNDEMNLGDWFISIGLQTSDQIDLKQLYPVVDAMGDSQTAAANIAGFITAVNNLGENVHSESFSEKIPGIKDEIKEYNNSDAIGVFDNCDDEIQNRTIGFTNEAIRKHQAEFSLGKMSDYEIVKNKINEILGYINLAMGALFVGVYVVTAVAGAAIVITNLLFGGTCIVLCALNWVFMALSTACVFLNTVMFWAGPIVLGLTIGLMIGFWIGDMLREKKKNLHHSDKPHFVFDAPETAEGVIDIKYKSVRDDDGAIADINRGKQYKWTMMLTTTDTRVGSPIRADKDGNVFKMVKNNPNFIDGYDCARYFGDRNAGDVNFFCEDSGQFYLHYRTEASIAAASKSGSSAEFYESTDDNGEEMTDPAENPADNQNDNPAADSEQQPQQQEQESKNYIADLVVAIGKNKEEAKALLLKKSEPYNIINYDFSEDQDFATYIGYTITTNPDDAIRDLRVAPYAGQKLSVNYGDVKYTFIEILGAYTGLGVEQTKPQTDALFFTKDVNAGEPILADGLHPVGSYKEAEEYALKGWEPVSYFGNDIPYNFDTSYEFFDYEGVTGIRHEGGFNFLSLCSFIGLYYEPEIKYTSGEKYLSGIYFGGGYDIFETPGDMDIEETINTNGAYQPFSLRTYLNSYFPHAANMSNVNLSSSMGNTYFSIPKEGRYGKTYRHGNTQLYSFYTWTYNPKRAISNLAVYQGDTFSSTLPYEIAKPYGSTKCNYVAASCWQQQFSPQYKKVLRFVSPTHTYMNLNALSLNQTPMYSVLTGKNTKATMEGVKFGYGYMHIPPTGLYISGYVKGMDPLKLSDVIVTSNLSKLKKNTDGSTVSYTTSEKTLAGKSESNGVFRQIQELKNPNSTTPFSLSYPATNNSSTPLYIFVRGQQATQKKYISSLSLGSFSRFQYKQSNPKAKDEDFQYVDGAVNSQAMIGALSGCSDELIVYNLALYNQSDAWYNKQEGNVSSAYAPENKSAAYIGVTRTDKTDEAIKGVILYEYTDNTAPNEITLDTNVTYYCAGVKSPIYYEGRTYFLYYTRNKGAVPGKPIESISIDTVPIIKGSATNLCGRRNKDTTFGNGNIPNFIHLKYTKAEGFYTKLYVGRGQTKKEAMADLLSQGCVEVLDYDLNTGIRGRSIVLGYRSGGLDQAVLDKQKTEEAYAAKFAKQTEEAIYDIIVTSGEPFHPEGIVSKNIYYHPVGSSEYDSDLNGTEGRALHMYYANPYYSATYNKTNNANTLLPQDVFTGYITHLALTESDRVPYNSTSAATNQSSNAYKWEYIMKNGDTEPVDLNEGAVSYSPHHAQDIRISMFAQRSDGSIKPAAEITGGFIESKYNVGDLKFGK